MDCIADPRIKVAPLLKINAVNILLCHNHPSGRTKPSRANELMKEKIKEVARCLDMDQFIPLIIPLYLIVFLLANLY